MKAKHGKEHHLRKLICEHDFMNIHERLFMKEVDMGVTPIYEGPFMNEIELHKQMNPHEHTQYKKCQTVQSLGDLM